MVVFPAFGFAAKKSAAVLFVDVAEFLK